MNGTLLVILCDSNAVLHALFSGLELFWLQPALIISVLASIRGRLSIVRFCIIYGC